MKLKRLLGSFVLLSLCSAFAEDGVVKEWKDKYAHKQNVEQWNKDYELPYNSWFGDEDNVAERWFLYFGPLGIRVNAHDASWGGMKSFKKRFPSLLVDKEGDLTVNAMEVLHIIPGSPAEGKLEVGDLIVEMEGVPFKTSSFLDHGGERYQFQDIRSLEMHAGELMDAAEGRGEVKFKVIRPSSIKETPAISESAWKNVQVLDFKEKVEGNRAMPFSLSVKSGELCRFIVTDGGNGNGGDGFYWKNMILKNAQGKEIALTDLTPLTYTVGYGGLNADKNAKSFWAHSASEIVIPIPEGEWTLSGEAAPESDATVEAQISVRELWQLPQALAPHAKEVKISIPKLGTYAEGGITGDNPKVKRVIDMTAAWLVAQQNEDGSWTRPAGYTSSHYDTALVGLALMATGDAQFDAAIKKAAEFVAFSGTVDGWSTPLAVATAFLSEYWLKYQDDRVLPAIENATKIITGQMLYGDYVSGHGHNPGYDGTGVSIGGSHCTLALTLAAKTPVKFDRSVIEKMLIRAQEISPRGVTPYGRTTDDLRLDPDLESGATYSGRHGPYLVASYIHGGPEAFTKNCSALYTHGVVGGADQGHSTETLSLYWTFPASACISTQAYERQMNSFLWKLAMLRGFDGGFCFNANRMEYQGAEGVLNVYIRTAAWLLGLCSDRHNLAITGKPEYKAKSFMNVPPVAELEVRILSYYQRNWSLVLAALGKEVPAELQDAYDKLMKIQAIAGCRDELMTFLKENSVPLAQKMLKLPNGTPLQRAYYAEIMLGVDTRITLDSKKGDGDKLIPGEYKLEYSINEPFWGHSPGIFENGESKPAQPILPFSGSVEIIDARQDFKGLEPFTYSSEKEGSNYRNTFEKKSEVTTARKLEERLSLKARIAYKIGDLAFEYERPITVNRQEEWNPGRKLYNDRQIAVPGWLIRDHGQWGMSFLLPDGTYISAAAQERSTLVHDPKTKTSWVTPRDRTLTAGTAGVFSCSTGWYGLEARIPEMKLVKEGAPSPKIKNIIVNGKPVDIALLQDNNDKTKIPVESKEDGTLEIIATLEKPEVVRGVDYRDGSGPWHWSCKVKVSVEEKGKWKDVHWSTFCRISSDLYDFAPHKTQKVKLTFTHRDKFTIDFSELHLFGNSALPKVNKAQ